jgi:hypothetical protein
MKVRYTRLTERDDRIIRKGMGVGATNDPSRFGGCLNDLRINGCSCNDDAKDKQVTYQGSYFDSMHV